MKIWSDFPHNAISWDRFNASLCHKRIDRMPLFRVNGCLFSQSIDTAIALLSSPFAHALEAHDRSPVTSTL
jgi:hypothetical protein